MTDDFDWDERRCPLYVIRKHRAPDGHDWVREIEPCEQPLHVEYTESKYLLAGGECDSCGPTWQVICEGGHVLVLPDHQADDHFDAIPFDLNLVNKALGVTVAGS
jgi:hypothetical protein